MGFTSEDAILDCISRYFPREHPSLLLGRGDDCAVLRPGKPLCVSTDLFLENVHFRRSYFTPQEVGYKALAVNLSDLAASGARPVGFTLGLALPEDLDVSWGEGFFEGMSQLAARYHVGLAGGDLSCADSIHISITAWGESWGGEGNAVWLSRGGALPGDCLFLIGHVGLARVGLALLEEQGNAARESWTDACNAHLRPEIQVDAGLILARAACNAQRPPALMDVSDGLAKDLPRLLGQNLGAEILLPEALLHPLLVTYARGHDRSPVEEAMLGGEDYALLGSCAPELLPALHAALPGLQSIGTVTDREGILCNGAPLPVTGFDHFSR